MDTICQDTQFVVRQTGQAVCTWWSIGVALHLAFVRHGLHQLSHVVQHDPLQLWDTKHTSHDKHVTCSPTMQSVKHLTCPPTMQSVNHLTCLPTMQSVKHLTSTNNTICKSPDLSTNNTICKTLDLFTNNTICKTPDLSTNNTICKPPDLSTNNTVCKTCYLLSPNNTVCKTCNFHPQFTKYTYTTCCPKLIVSGQCSLCSL